MIWQLKNKKRGQAMNKGQRTIHRKMKNSDKNCVIRIFPLKEY